MAGRRFLRRPSLLGLVDRGEHLLVALLTLLLLLVSAVASLQLLVVVLLELRQPALPWIGERLTTLLGDVLNVLIALEVMQTIASYLRRGVVQLELVLVTAITAVARKVIVLPKDLDHKPELLIGLGVVVICLTLALHLVRRRVDEVSSQARASRSSLNPQARTGPATPSLALDPSPAPDGGDGEEATADRRG